MEHLESLKSVFKDYFQWSVYRIDFFGSLISAIVRSRSVNMQKVAENMEGSAKTASNYRRIQRVFKEQKIDFDMSTILPDDEKWILTIDRTNWKLGTSNVNLLVLAVAHQGMAIPLLWKFLTKEESGKEGGETSAIGKRGNSDYKERRELIERFIRIFGKERIKALSADREFIGVSYSHMYQKTNLPHLEKQNSSSL